jgi:hypothetical protein
LKFDLDISLKLKKSKMIIQFYIFNIISAIDQMPLETYNDFIGIVTKFDQIESITINEDTFRTKRIIELEINHDVQ